MRKFFTILLASLMLLGGCAKGSDSSTPAHPKEEAQKTTLPTPTHEPTAEEVSAAAQKIGIEMVDQTEQMSGEVTFDQVFGYESEEYFVVFGDLPAVEDAAELYKAFYQQYISPAETVEGIEVLKADSDVGNYVVLDAGSYQEGGAYFSMYRVNDKVVVFLTDSNHAKTAQQFMDMIDG